MSRERVPHRTVYYVNGVEYVDITVTKAVGTLGGVPRRDRLVEIYDDAGHMFAVVARGNTSEPPFLVLIAGPAGIVPTMLLVPEGVVGAIVNFEPEVTVNGITEPCDELPTFCFRCPGTAYAINGPKLNQALGRSATRGVPRVRALRATLS